MLKVTKIAGAVSVVSAAAFAISRGADTGKSSLFPSVSSNYLRDNQVLCKELSSKWNWNWDKRQKGDVVDGTGTKKHYIFIRHGQYNMNGYDDDKRYLTNLGREQAKMTGERLSKLGLKYSRLVQSSMKRARETCSIISDQMSDLPIVETSDLLREGSPIKPDPSHRANEPELKYFSDSQRIESAFRKFVYRPSASTEDDQAEIYVCHANVIRYFICRVGQFPPERWLRMSLQHGSITWITVFSDGSAVINCIGDSGFMPSSKLSS